MKKAKTKVRKPEVKALEMTEMYSAEPCKGGPDIEQNDA
jgi:hypothetical protein